MPTYEYQCGSCGHELERFQSITARPLRKCPLCGRNTLRRLVGTGAGVIFKGSGFWQTDYRSEGYKKAAEKETKGDGEGGKGEDKGGKEKASGGAGKGSEPAKKKPAGGSGSSGGGASGGDGKKGGA